MLKYSIKYSDGTGDGNAEREIECDWVNQPTTTREKLQFMKNPNTVELEVSPASIMDLVLVSGTPVYANDQIYDEADGPPEN